MTVRSAFLAVSVAALLAGCGSMNLGGDAKTEAAADAAPAQAPQTPNTMTVAAAERKSVLVCVVEDPKQNVEALERAVVEGVKATGVTARVVKAGDNVSACKGLLTYGVAVKDGKLTGMVYQMNEGNKVALRATGPAKDGKMTLQQAAPTRPTSCSTGSIRSPLRGRSRLPERERTGHGRRSAVFRSNHRNEKGRGFSASPFCCVCVRRISDPT